MLKLSEAILLGSIVSKPGKGSLIKGDEACGIGAGLVGAGLAELGGSTNNSLILVAVEEWPLLSQPMTCPVCNHKSNGHWVIGVHLNDLHDWTRPEQAAFIATVEQQLEQKQQELTSTHLLEVEEQLDKATVQVD